MTNFENAKSFLFVYPQNLPLNDIQLLLEFAHEIKAEKKDVFFLIYHDFKKVPDNTVVKSFDIHLSKKDFNLFKMPSSSLIKRQVDLQYDYLFSFLENENVRLENFIKKSNARIKIGRWEPPNKSIYRITFSANGHEKSMEEFLKMAGNYLTKIKIEK
jgi:hypothetical protein